MSYVATSAMLVRLAVPRTTEEGRGDAAGARVGDGLGDGDGVLVGVGVGEGAGVAHAAAVGCAAIGARGCGVDVNSRLADNVAADAATSSIVMAAILKRGFIGPI